MAETKGKQESLSLIQKLAKIREISDVVKKDKRGYNYSYADITNILASITAGMKKWGVSLIPLIVPQTAQSEQLISVNTKVDKSGKAYDNTTTEMLVSADMIFKWVNDDNTQDFIEVPWFVIGAQSDPSQAFGSGITYCTRYFLTSYFQIAQTDTDVDAYRSKQKEAEETEDRAIAEQIVRDFDLYIKGFLADNPEHADKAKRFISRYVKNSNYLSIKNPEIASKLSEEFKTKFETKIKKDETKENLKKGDKK